MTDKRPVMNSKTLDVNQVEWEREVLNSDVPVLVDFWAEWCGPCKMVAPIVNQIADEYDGKLRVVKVNADANPDLLTQYGVMGIPTLLLMKDGVAVERIAGYQSKDKILSKLAIHI
jgi:thioredoxin 1